jgi:hypothetical protein
MKSIISKTKPPSSRWMLFTPTVFLAFFLIQIAEVRFQKLGTNRSINSHGFYMLCLAMAILFAAQWLYSALGRAAALRLNRLWVLAHLLPWLAVVGVIVMGTSQQFNFAIILALAAELPIALLPLRQNKGKSESVARDGEGI